MNSNTLSRRISEDIKNTAIVATFMQDSEKIPQPNHCVVPNISHNLAYDRILCTSIWTDRRNTVSTAMK